MPEIPSGNSLRRQSESPTTETQSAADCSARQLAEGGTGLSIEQKRFAVAVGQALAGTWRRESASVDEIRGAVAKQLN
jgi:hypothetical protein